ncbi:DUF550 domain-containing protein [Citrobacter freundii]|uniref:DUF550 domain-containing protein n=1 Tax=Citrobacter freundii TaxID=546 RepID=UPI003890FBE7
MTTNNHPANGPVSLDRLHQISEILSKAAAQSDGGNLGYAMADAVKVFNGVLESMAREQVRREHAAWSLTTFGDVGPVGPLKHLSKEALEAAAEPGDLSEWADMQFLLWDAQRRAGISDGEITAAMEEKLKVNIARQWPEPKDGEPRLHIKEQPAPVVPDEYRHLSELYHAQEKRLFKLAQRIKGPSFDKYAHSPSQAIDVLEAVIFGEDDDSCRAVMLQSFGNSEKLDEVGSWNNHINTPTAKPAIDTGELLKHIEGMEVSVDVSTCDADAGHRYFGTVTEISELDTAKNGYILLVQDAKPNFKQAGNSPVTPDGWQLVPKEPTEAMNKAGWAAINEHDAINPTYRAMLAAAPQQDVRLALEIGMSRYAGAMQKLVDSGD